MDLPTQNTNSPTTNVEIYDSTLRDGAQAQGITYSVDDKLLIAHRLDELGVHYIEGGWPNRTNPSDLEFFRRAKSETWKQVKQCRHN